MKSTRMELLFWKKAPRLVSRIHGGVVIPAGKLNLNLPTCSLMTSFESVTQRFARSVDDDATVSRASRRSRVAPLLYVDDLAAARCFVNPSFNTGVAIGHSSISISGVWTSAFYI